jgi:type IV pilus assembly protein PilF
MSKFIVVFLMSLAALMVGCQSNPLTSDADMEAAHLDTQYKRGQSKQKTVADLNAELGAGYIRNGRYDRALAKLQKALRFDSDHALAHNYIAVLYGRLDQTDLAYKHFKRSLKIDPHSSTAINNYAIFLCEQGKYEDAQTQFKKVFKNPLYINRSGSYQSAAACADLKGDYVQAEKYFRKALELNTEMPQSLLGLSRIYYKQGNYDFAWNYFQRFDEISRQNSDSLWLGINILNKLEQPDYNKLSSYELELKSKYPDTDEAKWYFEGRQDY